MHCKNGQGRTMQAYHVPVCPVLCLAQGLPCRAVEHPKRRARGLRRSRYEEGGHDRFVCHSHEKTDGGRVFFNHIPVEGPRTPPKLKGSGSPRPGRVIARTMPSGCSTQRGEEVAITRGCSRRAALLRRVESSRVMSCCSRMVRRTKSKTTTHTHEACHRERRDTRAR